MRHRLLIFVMGCLCITSSPSIVSGQEGGTLSYLGRLVLPLPEDCTEIPSDVVFSEEDGKHYLYVVNEIENQIVVFDIKSKTCHPLSLDPEPNFRIGGIGVLGKKLFVYNYRKECVQYYLDRKFVRQYELRQEEFVQGKRTPIPFVQTLSPIKAYDNQLILTGFRAGEVNRSPDIPDLVLTILDLNSGKITHAVEMPLMYGKYNWGGGFAYRMPYFDLGHDGEVVCCFAASDEIASYSLKSGETRRTIAASRHFKSILPYSKTDRKTPDGGSEMRWYRNNPSYDGILYDPWREVYYRLALQPERAERKGTEHQFRKPVSIIVLDKNLQVLGETLLDTSAFFRPYCCFVSPDGLFIQVLDGDDDHLTFYRYQYAKKSS